MCLHSCLFIIRSIPTSRLGGPVEDRTCHRSLYRSWRHGRLRIWRGLRSAAFIMRKNAQSIGKCGISTLICGSLEALATGHAPTFKMDVGSPSPLGPGIRGSAGYILIDVKNLSLWSYLIVPKEGVKGNVRRVTYATCMLYNDKFHPLKYFFTMAITSSASARLHKHFCVVAASGTGGSHCDTFVPLRH